MSKVPALHKFGTLCSLIVWPGSLPLGWSFSLPSIFRLEPAHLLVTIGAKAKFLVISCSKTVSDVLEIFKPPPQCSQGLPSDPKLLRRRTTE